ncbi:MAG: nucleotidyltransferase domain-containing protein [Deltaproteobacteria bacterium]|nr:nucleotidyltransferase domain-containing protein [Deltaproteobacteria bacterium]
MSRPNLPPVVQLALAEAVGALRSQFGTRLCEVRLFGSYARGTAGPASDIDLLVVLDRVANSADRFAAMGTVIDAGLRHELLLEPMVLGMADLEHRRRCETALAAAWDREGVTL